MRRIKPAFTLVELLTVLAILLIVAALLAPVFASTKNSAKAIQCATHLKQLSLSALIYGSDHGDAMPYAPCPYAAGLAKKGLLLEGNPFNEQLLNLPDAKLVLQAYGATDGHWRCPADFVPNEFRQGRSDTWFFEVGSSYSYAYFLGLSGVRFSQIEFPDRRMMFGDVDAFHFTGDDRSRFGKGNAALFSGGVRRLSGREMIQARPADEFWY